MTDEYQQFLDQFLHANTHVVSAISDDQNTVEIVSTRTRTFRKPLVFTSVLSVDFKATDSNRHALQVGDQLLLETTEGVRHYGRITISPKDSRLPSFNGNWTAGNKPQRDAKSQMHRKLLPDSTESSELNLGQKSSPGTTSPALTRKLIQQNLPTIRPALRLTAASVMAQLSEFRERVRSNNQLRVEDEQFHEELLMALDQLASDVESLYGAMSVSDGPATEKEIEATASWLKSFQSRTEEKIATCSDPNRAADIAFPVGITLGFGAIGALIGLVFEQGMAGFVAGGFLARIALGEAKSSEVTSEIEKGLENNESPDKPY